MSIRVMSWVWQHSQSKGTARLVLLAIADCASDDGANAYPSMAELVRKTGLSQRTVQSLIADLSKLGELIVAYNAGPHGTNRYRVSMATPAESAPPQNLHPRKPRIPQPAESSQANPQTPADSAPPRRICTPPQNSRGTPAESAPGTVNEPSVKQDSPSESQRARAKSRATRVPDDFQPTTEMIAWAREHAPTTSREDHDAFMDHWRSSNAPGARKRDWVMAWRNWMRRENERRARGTQRASPAPRPSTTDQRMSQADQAVQRLKARLAADQLEITAS